MGQSIMIMPGTTSLHESLVLSCTEHLTQYPTTMHRLYSLVIY